MLNKISVLSGFVISDNPKQSSRVPVFIKVLDVNDNAPEFAMFYETFVCENAKAEQVCCLLVLVLQMNFVTTLASSHQEAYFALHQTVRFAKLN